MEVNLKKILERKSIETSAPCRIDLGGTLDISTFYYPLRHLSPCTVNMAIDLRTSVKLFPYDAGMVKVSSKGFESTEFPMDEAPFDHPLGLMFAIAAYFRAQGVHIDIDSSSPPRSALGGSSAAAVALIAAFSKAFEEDGGKPLSRKETALLAHMLESSVAGIPCGVQDHLAAAYGGVNIWYWPERYQDPLFRKKTIVKKRNLSRLEQHLMLAYCGVPHESKNVNQKWVQQFLSGMYRGFWAEIIVCAQKFGHALAEQRMEEACQWMNRETEIRRKMTPEVLDEVGAALVQSALENNCGARFTGAGGGGCIWALGHVEYIDKLKGTWEYILSTRKGADMLDMKLDARGISSIAHPIHNRC